VVLPCGVGEGCQPESDGGGDDEGGVVPAAGPVWSFAIGGGGDDDEGGVVTAAGSVWALAIGDGGDDDEGGVVPAAGPVWSFAIGDGGGDDEGGVVTAAGSVWARAIGDGGDGETGADSACSASWFSGDGATAVAIGAGPLSRSTGITGTEATAWGMASAACRSKSRAEARSPFFKESSARLTSATISSASRRSPLLFPCPCGDCSREAGAVSPRASCDGCEDGEGGGAVDADSTCCAGSLVSTSWFGRDGRAAAEVCVVGCRAESRSLLAEFTETGAASPRALTAWDGCNGGEGGITAGAGSACEAWLTAATWLGTDGVGVAAPCEGSLSP